MKEVNVSIKIYEVLSDAAGTAMEDGDKLITTRLLREICRQARVQILNQRRADLASISFGGCDLSVEAGYCDFRVRLEDQHMNETKPHYVLDVGDSIDLDLERFKRSALKVQVPYCDFQTVVTGGAFAIDQDPGQFTLWIYGPLGGDPVRAAKEIAVAYDDAMRDALPDYFILIDHDGFEVEEPDYS